MTLSKIPSLTTNSLRTPFAEAKLGPRGKHRQAPPVSAVVQDAKNGALLECLRLLLADECWLADAARSSYRHQLGFWKFVLLTSEDGSSLRLHVWDQPSATPEDIHSHCANFQSRLVLGRLSENAYHLAPGVSHSLFRYRFDNAMGHSVAVADGLTGILPQEYRTLLSGTTYRKESSDLHSVSNVERGTVTISAWEPRHSEALVLKPCGAISEDCAASAGMQPNQMRMVLLNTIKRLIEK